jgi:hypothetical protein
MCDVAANVSVETARRWVSRARSLGFRLGDSFDTFHTDDELHFETGRDDVTFVVFACGVHYRIWHGDVPTYVYDDGIDRLFQRMAEHNPIPPR